MINNTHLNLIISQSIILLEHHKKKILDLSRNNIKISNIHRILHEVSCQHNSTNFAQSTCLMINNQEYSIEHK